MAYKLCVPIWFNQDDDIQREGILKQLKESKTDVVFLIFNRVLTDNERLKKEVDIFNRNKSYFESHGFKVYAWLIPSIGYGGIASCDGDAPNRYTHIVADNGYVCPGAYCPLDEGFTQDFLHTISELAKTGVEGIMLEDDYTLGGGKFTTQAVGCLCEHHRKKLLEITGEDLTLPEIRERLHGGKPNEYRSKFLDLEEQTLIDFTKKIEKAVHSVNPKIRLGLSANGASYQIEGATLSKLVKAIAGSARPFVRLTGAPYWEDVPSLAPKMETVRWQCDLLKDTGADLMTEGDTFPRPRHIVPANYLEGYDMVLRASGESQGILKYMSDYYSRPNYENGYFERHNRNEKHYAEIEKRFSGKETVGLNVVGYPSLYRVQDYSTDVSVEDLYGYGSFLPFVSQWFTTDNSIPTTYGKIGEYPSLLFGENARLFDLNALNAGTILDGTAARILSERGVDVGFESYEIMPTPLSEYYKEYQDYTTTFLLPYAKSYNFKLKKGAEVLSEHPVAGGASWSDNAPDKWKTAPRIPAVYRYENKKGQRFVVFSFVSETAWGKYSYVKGNFKSYYRQRQLVEGVEYVAKKPLPAVCLGNPFLYILAKKDKDSMAVGIWNFFADEVINPVIQLDEEYGDIDIYQKSGRLDGNKVILDEDIPPYGFVLFTVFRKK